jgi:hypothetical protein
MRWQRFERRRKTKLHRRTIAVYAAGILGVVCLPAQDQPKKDYPIQPVSFTAVHVNDQFWAPRLEINRKVSIPTAFEQCERTGRVDNFVRAAMVLEHQDLKDKHAPGYPFDDTDPYKVIEGASYALSVHPDPELDAYLDKLIAKIAAAQEPDGYIYTTRTIDPEHPHAWSGSERWVNEEVQSHELYNLGHLYEAAVAHYEATGKRTLLDVALKSADLLVRTFGPGKRAIYPGHQIAEMGLVKLYRVTGREQYLTLAQFLLDSRHGGRSYNQADKPVIEQTEAEGHAVRATYMYSGMADVAAMTGDENYIKAIDAIWQNVVNKKMYLTGGIGSVGAIEGFGPDYDLPNMSAYNETCAAVGDVFWNQRLFLLHGDAKYVDILERTLYNGLISGVSLDGETYFYPNPLESNGQHQRSPWFGVACCPGNITRFMPSLPGYVYAHRGDAIYVNLFMSNRTAVTLAGGRKVELEQETRYPWAGDVQLTVRPEKAGVFTLKIRVPGWARGAAMPGDLYRFADEGKREPVTLQINGASAELKLDNGYATLTREWKAGDRVDLHLPMRVERVLANQNVEADRGRVALQRGPIVFCAEWADSPDRHVRNIVLDNSQKLQAEFLPTKLKGVEEIHGEAVAYRYDGKGELLHANEAFTAIPYYAWANRGRGQMEVWIAENEAQTHPTPYPTIASTSKVTVSGATEAANGARDPHMVADLEEPTSSSDANSYYDWWPKKGTTEWIQYDFTTDQTVSSTDVYWFAPKKGDVALPQSWRILYLSGDEWKPVEASAAYAVAPDRYNRVAFSPIRTRALRLEVTLRPDKTAGVSEWKVQ